jgi:prophage regulatory protein
MQRRRLEAAGRFPRRVVLSPRKHGYLYSELMAWIRERLTERDAPSSAAE